MIEIWTLLAACLLGLIHMSAASFTFKAQVGNAYTVGARDENLQPTGIAGRLQRAHHNFHETFAIFAVLIILVVMLEAQGTWSYWGALLYIGGRTLFLPLYAIGVEWLGHRGCVPSVGTLRPLVWCWWAFR